MKGRYPPGTPVVIAVEGDLPLFAAEETIWSPGRCRAMTSRGDEQDPAKVWVPAGQVGTVLQFLEDSSRVMVIFPGGVGWTSWQWIKPIEDPAT